MIQLNLEQMTGAAPASRAWKALILAVVRHLQTVVEREGFEPSLNGFLVRTWVLPPVSLLSARKSIASAVGLPLHVSHKARS